MMQPKTGLAVQRHLIKVCLISSVILYNHGALALEPADYITDGGLHITPLLKVGANYDDNIFSETNGKTSSGIIIIEPSVTFKLDDGINIHSLAFSLTDGTYLSSSDDNYLDGFIFLKTHMEPNDTHRFDFSVKGDWVTEPRGTGLSEGQGDTLFSEPVTYLQETVAGTYEYGAKSTKGRIALDAEFNIKDYRNFEGFTDVSDYDSLLLGATFFYSTNANTDLFIELTGETIRYDFTKPNAIKRDSDVYTGLVGARWDASSLITGFAKLGAQQKEFTDSRRDDFSGFSWDIGIEWRPLSYSKVDLSTSRATKDPDINGDYIIDRKIKIGWKHYWNSLISTEVRFTNKKEEYSGFDREDDINELWLAYNYDFRRWATISFFAKALESDSTQANIVYDKNVIGTQLTFSL